MYEEFSVFQDSRRSEVDRASPDCFRSIVSAESASASRLSSDSAASASLASVIGADD